jgi:hypothetical protein
MSDNGKYCPFDYTKRDCKTCKNYIEKVENRNGAEYMRCTLSPNFTAPYYENGILCARYEKKERESHDT